MSKLKIINKSKKRRKNRKGNLTFEKQKEHFRLLDGLKCINVEGKRDTTHEREKMKKMVLAEERYKKEGGRIGYESKQSILYW